MDTPLIIARRKEKLDLFEKSIGKPFSCKAKLPDGKRTTSIMDYVEGVDRKFEHVIGRKYGNFHIDLVALADD
jgi:hypothetical protein